MCGIFAYVNYHVRRTKREILNTLLDGLKAVEYRGYDSAGVCVDNANTKEPLACIRSVGNIEQLRSLVFDKEHAATLELDTEFDNHVGIAHTRWATHGVPSVSNCHPQMSNNKEFAIVHNGMITDFMSVKEMLLEKGYHFDSDTDTEVIAVLVEYLFSQEPTLSFVELTAKLTGIVDGAYALLIKSKHFPGELIACRKSSPLVVGIRQEKKKTTTTTAEGVNGNKNGAKENEIVSDACEIYLASDANSFISYTQEVVFLEDDDIAHFHDGVLSFYTTTSSTDEENNNNNNNDNANTTTTAKVEAIPVKRTTQIIDHTPEGLSKNGYDHFMLKEIHEQPETVTRSMHARLDFQTSTVHMEGFDDNVLNKLRAANRIMLIACGTSFHSCIAVRPIFEELLPGMNICVENAPDFMDREPTVHKNDLCVFVSQSGETADTLVSLQHCKKSGAILVGLTNVPGSSVLRQTDYTMMLNAGVEVGVASTKAYTSQMIVLTLFALLLSQYESKSKDYERIQKRRVEIIHGLNELPSAIGHCLKNVEKTVKTIAEEWKDADTILVLGRGYDYATALESALKVKEVSYVYTEGVHAGELKHGPIALVDSQSRVIAFCTHDRYFERSKSAIQQVKARGGRLVSIITQKDMEIAKAAELCVEVPTVVDCLQGVINILPLQLLAYYLAVRRGHNVDCPRNLAKSVTVQ
ncbi:putative glucosamine-fructose-6-phosphate aminotransferase [Trypanosoma theileri]|uniref:glutamine--fructose-6-phosphate transaminase (isomerizing) n=1 Tax=Trypanosoma theileri TaxID=67003 RepID=A0A1X0NLC5_9TRYP|nr:putative glucosamine-fructose-6-phosphate aminotransferase [Trypanosoma theileri]ORC85328.1 putative glucosamine-fructose-6-phosphate aminotransferase [Trypanosoma theileri]